MALHLEKQLQFYGSYHHTPVNKGIHIVCVPAILMSAILLCTNSPAMIPMPEWSIIPNLPPNVGTIGALVYSTLYILMEPVAGGLLAPILMGGTAYSKHLTTEYGATANKWALAVFVSGWIFQFVGHGFFEKRAPALLDNLIQAIFLAPFFVWMEILFFFGYRPELHHRVAQAVEKDVQEFRQSKEVKPVSNGNGRAT